MAIETIKQLAVQALEDCGQTPPPDFEMKLAEAIARTLGGNRVYIAGCPFDKQKRNATIRAEFNGANMRRLCNVYRISPRTVYRIINTKNKLPQLP